VVTRIERLADGSLAVSAGHIDVIVPRGFPAEASLDREAHICVYRNIEGRYVVRCLFLPGEA